MANSDDSRLNRLLEYTKFHIGVYLALAGGIAGSKLIENRPEGLNHFTCPLFFSSKGKTLSPRIAAGRGSRARAEPRGARSSARYGERRW